MKILALQAGSTYKELQAALSGVSEALSWATPELTGFDYLNTDGSIMGITLHVASSKVMYGSIAFRNAEIKWRDVAEELDAVEPSWSAAQAYLAKAHEYWMSTWEHLNDSDLNSLHPHFSGVDWPAWKLIHTVTGHDSYHAGQIAVLRATLRECSTPSESVAADIRKYCAEFPSY